MEINPNPSPDDLSDDFTPEPGNPEPNSNPEPNPNPTPEPKPSLLTKDDLKDFAVEFGKSMKPQEVQKQLTPEEIDAQLQVWKPSEDLYDRLSAPETRGAAFIEMRDGIMRQALTAVQHMLGSETGKIREEFAGVQTFAQEQRATKLREQFTTTYPALQKYEKIMPMVSAALEKSGYKPQSVEEGFKKLADEAAKVIKENFDPEFDLASKPNDQSGQNGQPPMSTAPQRGGQGGASSTKSGASKSPDDGLWD